MNLPTRLTLARILLTFAVMALSFMPGWMAKAAALLLFVLASLTDWLDGYLARRWNQCSPLGALLDPIADKVLILGTLLAFVQLRLVPAWMVLMIALREFLITGVRLIAAHRRVVLAAASEGKQKMVSQVLTIVLVLIVLAVRDALSEPTQAMLQGLILGCMWVTMLLTVMSGGVFFWRHRHILKDAVTR